MDQWAGVILAAGMGERMKSSIPKVLHRVCGKEMVRYPVELLQQAGLDRIVVVVSPANGPAVRELLGDQVEYVLQPSPLGTGDALAQTTESLRGSVENVLVVGTDSPLLQASAVKELIVSHLSSSDPMSILVGNTPSVGDFGECCATSRGR